jgi:hypothetical protein
MPDTKKTRPGAGNGSLTDPPIQWGLDLKQRTALEQSISQTLARFDSFDRLAKAAVDRADSVLALREGLETVLRDPRVQRYAPMRELLEKVLEALPGLKTPISQFHADRIAEALAAPGISRMNSNNAGASRTNSTRRRRCSTLLLL